MAVSEPLNFRIIGCALHTAIPASIVVSPVAVLFSVRFIVLAIEGNQVVQREAIVAGDEIDALLRLAFFVSVYVRAPVSRKAIA